MQANQESFRASEIEEQNAGVDAQETSFKGGKEWAAYIAEHKLEDGPSRLIALVNDFAGVTMSHVSLTNGAPGDKYGPLVALAVAMGEDLESASKNITKKNMGADFKAFSNNVMRDIDAIKNFGGKGGLGEAEIAMAVNSYVLSRYYALIKDNPDFMWTQMGIFAANTVRNEMVKLHAGAGTFDIAALGDNITSKMPGGIEFKEVAAGLRDMANGVLEGQIDVLKDVGSLAMMHKIYGAQAMSTAKFDGMTREARDSFKLQVQAETARASGDMQRFYKLQTDAAIEMGRHEQKNILQEMWDRFDFSISAKANAYLMKYTGGIAAFVRPDIYIGTNRANDNDYARTITAPRGSEDLTIVENRVNIARNGFNILNAMRQTPDGNKLIMFHQERLGKSIGLLQAIKFPHIPDLPHIPRLPLVIFS